MPFDPDAFLADSGGFDPDSFLGTTTVEEPIAQPEISPSQQEQSLDWSDVPMEALSNVPKSAGEFAGNIYQAVRHPVETGGALVDLFTGVVQSALPEQWQAESASGQRQLASNVADFFADRYGGIENLKQTMAKDPVGFLADASIVLTGGGAAASKIPGIAKAGQTVAKVGKAVNPLTMAGKVIKPVAKAAGKGVSELVGGLGTHTGGESLRLAAKAGYKGGDVAEDFKSAMRGGTNMEEVVSDAKQALSNMRKAKSTAYRSGMANIAKDKKVLDFKPINESISDIYKIGTFKGKSVSKSTTGTMKQIKDVVSDWKKSNPYEFHTPEGMDALKRAIGDIRDSTDFGTPSRLMADKVYHAVKGQIVKQAPEYAKVMSGYEKGTKLIKEIEKSLSLGEKATADTALRKLQSVLRDNVNTNYGRRGELASELVDAGATNLMEKLSGQSLSSVAPRGLGRLVASGLGGAGVATANPALLAPIALQSPRLMGEAAYYGGKTARGLSGAQKQIEALLNKGKMTTRGAAAGAYQAGRLEENK